MKKEFIFIIVFELENGFLIENFLVDCVHSCSVRRIFWSNLS